jgi:tripeptidyl-peptidase-1
MLWHRLLASTALFAGALSISTSHVLHEKRSVTLPYKRQRVNGDSIVPIRIGLRQSNLHTGYDRLSKGNQVP